MRRKMLYFLIIIFMLVIGYAINKVEKNKEENIMIQDFIESGSGIE